MIGIQLTGVRETISEFEDIDKSQVPFAFALSLTRTAQIAQRAERNALGLHFTIRRRSFMEQGIRIKAATKAKPQAVIQDIDPFMDLQEDSGEKRAGAKYKAFTYKGLVAVPLEGARPRNTSLVREQDYPEAVMRSLGFIRWVNGVRIMFEHTWKRTGGRRLRRTGVNSAGRTEQTGIKAMYALVPSCPVKKRWGFTPRVTETVQRVWPGEFNKAFDESVRSAAKKFVG